MAEAKPYTISKKMVWDAYQLVRRNGGAPGVDGMTIEDVDADAKNMLYKLWNRMSSGSYMPQAVRRVDIPKKDGGSRPLGIPTVLDRIAQMTARLYLEPILDPCFHPDSYGYRPNKSAHQAVGKARERCWKYDFVIDLDIKGFFDNIDHELLLKALDMHKPAAWVRLYAERWLKTPVRKPDGTMENRTAGTPQGGVISPLLANLFLHYAIDKWMLRNHGNVPFERYADDIVIHCCSYEQAQRLLKEIIERLNQCKLRVHPEKTKIVYCKDQRRRGEYQNIEFDFLGFTFRPRRTKARSGRIFLGFNPAISTKSKKAIRDTIRGWKIHRRTGSDLQAIATAVNIKLRGWINYYGKFRISEMQTIFNMLQGILIKWARNRFKKYKRSWVKAGRYLAHQARIYPNMFAHWAIGWNLNGCI